MSPLPMLIGCGTTLIMPPGQPREPTPLFVLDHRRRTSLVLSAPDGSLHRYAYSDWGEYAERDTSLLRGLAALLCPTPGALGHRLLAGPATAFAVQQQLRVRIVELHGLRLERLRVDDMRNRLDLLITRADMQIPAPEVDLVFVPDPRHTASATTRTGRDRLAHRTGL